MKYNQALDYFALAAAAFDKGDAKEAGRLVTAALKAPDREVAVEAMLDHNEAATAARVRAKSKVSASDDGCDDEDSPGDELRVEVDENKPRETQVGGVRAAARRVNAAAQAKKTNYFASLK